MVRLHERVFASGLPNYNGLRIPLPSKLKHCTVAVFSTRLSQQCYRWFSRVWLACGLRLWKVWFSCQSITQSFGSYQLPVMKQFLPWFNLLPWWNNFYLDINLLPWWNNFYLDINLMPWLTFYLLWCPFTAVLKESLPWYQLTVVMKWYILPWSQYIKCVF